jgi:hypothetical protein
MENSEIKDGQIDWRPAPDVVEELLAAAGYKSRSSS